MIVERCLGPWRRQRTERADRALDPATALSEDRGAVSTMVAVLGAAIFMSLALVVDGGRQLAALTEAQNIADNAARYGSQEVDLDAWRETGVPVLLEGDATDRAEDYIDNVIPPGIDVVDRQVVVADDTITVTVEIARREFFFGSSTATATQSATALDGVDSATP